MQQSLIQLVIAWTLVGAFVFTVIVTCASLVGWIRFSEPSQQRKLFYVLIVQIVGLGVTYFGNLLNFSPAVAARDVVSLSNFDYWKSFHHNGVPGIQKPNEFPDEYRYAFDGVQGRLQYYQKLNVYVETNQREGAPPYHYYFRPVKRDDAFLYVYDDSRAFALKLPLASGMSYFSGNGANGPFTEFQLVDAK
jgi:hypothetical protein